MHIRHITADGRALVTLPIKWEQVPSDEQKFGVLSDGVHTSPDGLKAICWLWGEFRFSYGNDTWRAVRIRSGYGWCSWEIYKNGVLVSAKGGGELPERMDLYVPVEVARAVNPAK